MLGEFYAAPEVHFILEFILCVLTLLASPSPRFDSGNRRRPSRHPGPFGSRYSGPYARGLDRHWMPRRIRRRRPSRSWRQRLCREDRSHPGLYMQYRYHQRLVPPGWIRARDRSTLGAGLDPERILHRHTHAHLKSYHPRANVKSFQLIAQPGGMSQRICSGRGIQGGGYGNQEWNGIQVQCRSLQSFLPHGSI